MVDTNPFSMTNVFGGVFEPFKSWALPVGIILILIVIFLIIKSIQKKNSERNIDLIRRG
ncbi:MAG: hypothetical protein PHF67_00155 [Candidatus Nanoarchaeia archaeon]|nr:hypothetical protein [Candidatus Nanoarchaeia archaeon]